jgi:hypothetical protein
MHAFSRRSFVALTVAVAVGASAPASQAFELPAAPAAGDLAGAAAVGVVGVVALGVLMASDRDSEKRHSRDASCLRRRQARRLGSPTSPTARRTARGCARAVVEPAS